ncbi:hypothetical protein C8N46_10269 [Kordia periserrulae]|uniref:Alpha/beta hydrolase family protein n=1 Tax=Kordia periserrulae TaxID=701523 RepID=A0A2T6C305_9FLAO|nr:hypothetical protein [Kordia periserrulae]PTX62673.1 hypothetical protein C8N46_10269 [Kordia periserrulae]
MKSQRYSCLLIFACVLFSACDNSKQSKVDNSQTAAYTHVSTSTYELAQPKAETTAVLVLFGGFPEVAKDIQREFNILKTAKQHRIAVLYVNYNQKLWFEQGELESLSLQIQEIFTAHTLPNNKVFFGGFSSGGNVALLLGNYLSQQTTFAIQPKGIFIVDSPIDLAALYRSAEKNVQRNFSDASVQEGRFLLDMLGNRFGNPAEAIDEYEKYAVFTAETNYTDNLANLHQTKLRLYTEPDTLWWRQYRMADVEQMNAFYIKRLAEQLIAKNFKYVTYIPTENKGYRANGERHPHSWSIVDKEELIRWMLND